MNKDNFYIASSATFFPVAQHPGREPDYVSITEIKYLPVEFYNQFFDGEYKVDFEDENEDCGYITCLGTGQSMRFDTIEEKFHVEIGNSKYWYTKKGVYRQSDHWGRLGKCQWDLFGLNWQNESNAIAYASWQSLKDN